VRQPSEDAAVTPSTKKSHVGRHDVEGTTATREGHNQEESRSKPPAVDKTATAAQRPALTDGRNKAPTQANDGPPTAISSRGSRRRHRDTRNTCVCK